MTHLLLTGAGSASGDSDVVSVINHTWDSAAKATGITLFDGDREAWHQSGTSEAVRGTQGMNGGKFCFAMHYDGGIMRVGIATSAFDVNTDTLGGGTANTIITNSGVVFHNSGGLQDYTDYVDGDHILVAFDEPNGDLWFGRNTSWNGDPSAGTSPAKADVANGTWYPVFGSSSVGPVGKVTLIPWPSGIAVPTGFTVLEPTRNVDGRHWETVHFVTLAANSTGWNGFNLRQRLEASQLVDKSGTKIRAKLMGGTTENAQIDSAHWGENTGGDAYDIDGTPAAFTIGGSNSFTVNASSVAQSDEFTYTYSGGTPLIFAWHFNSAAADSIGSQNLVGYTHYHRSAAAETGTGNVTGYTTVANALRFLLEIQTYVAD